MSEDLVKIPIDTAIALSNGNNSMVGNNNKQYNAPIGTINTNVIQIHNDSLECTRVNLSNEFCNIFVIKDERFQEHKGSFIISKHKIIQCNAASDISLDSAYINAEAIAKIMTFPSLFMDVNHSYRQCKNLNQEFYYGLVTGIAVQGKNIKVSYQKLSNQLLLKQRLNEQSVFLGLNINNGRDVLDETGWIIKNIDIRKSLMSIGIYF